jgi:hypothetical protein
LETAEEDFQRSLAGEMSLSTYVTRFSDKAGSLASGDSSTPTKVRFPAQPLAGVWNPANLSQALLRFRKARVQADDYAEYEVYLNVDPDESLSPAHPNYAGEFKKYAMEEGKESLVLFDVTRAFRPFARPGERLSFTLQVAGGKRAEITWKGVDLAVLVSES